MEQIRSLESLVRSEHEKRKKRSENVALASAMCKAISETQQEIQDAFRSQKKFAARLKSA